MRFANILVLTTLTLIPEAWTSVVQTHDANFDDIVIDASLLDGQPIGVYDGLQYTNLDVGSNTGVIAGLKTKSPPNFAALNLLSAGASVPRTGTLTITGKTLYFALTSFYFGCGTSTGEPLVNIPTSCTLSVTGYKSGVVVAPTRSITFAPDNLVLSDLQQATFGSLWKHVDKVEIQQANPLLAVVFDDFVYTTVSG